VTYRGLAADDIIDLQSRTSKDLQLVERRGHRHQLSGVSTQGPLGREDRVRRAVAQLVDRGAITHKIYKDSRRPAVLHGPKGLTGHTTDFFDDFGDPSVAKAAKILSDAHITQRVPLTLWYTTDRYGSETALEFKELKRQLDAPDSSRSP